MKKENYHHVSLVGRKVFIVISEPWEFGDEMTSSTFGALITDVYVSLHIRQLSEKLSENLMVHLEEPFGYKKLKTEYLLASPRYEGRGLYELSKGEALSFNFCRASSERALSESPFDATRWKDDPSFGLIGELKVETH